jgi:thiosulfate dehydrogenase (quinone) large subunit
MVELSEETTDPPVQGGHDAAALRISLGWLFLWAFLDKAFDLGHETAHEQAWIRGGSPM